jgi:hydroxyacylglutathione hydrolase
MDRVTALRLAGEPSLPVTLGEERATNPFLRADDAALRAALGLPGDAAPLAVFTAARARKDRF